MVNGWGGGGISRMVNRREIVLLCESRRAAWYSSTEAHLGYETADKEVKFKALQGDNIDGGNRGGIVRGKIVDVGMAGKKM